MAGIVFFTQNYHDLSNNEGFQFEFFCERCGNGYRSPFQRDKVEMGRSLLRGVGNVLGGRFERFSAGAQELMWDRGTNSAAKDKALEAAVAAVRDQFRQCRGCSNWACVQVCWNHEIGQCLTCSPSVAEEMSRAQASAQKHQIWDKAQETDWTKGLDVGTRTVVTCPHCQAKVSGGKFCASCGGQMATAAFCASCGAQHAPDARFCASCGATLSDPRTG